MEKGDVWETGSNSASHLWFGIFGKLQNQSDVAPDSNVRRLFETWPHECRTGRPPFLSHCSVSVQRSNSWTYRSNFMKYVLFPSSISWAFLSENTFNIIQNHTKTYILIKHFCLFSEFLKPKHKNRQLKSHLDDYTAIFGPLNTKNIPTKHKMVAPLCTKLCLTCPLLTSGPPKDNKSGPFDHNIWALAVTTLTTKVSTRYIHGPLRWIRHISPPALEINEQQIIYGKYTLCWITDAGDCGDLYRSPTTQIMHSPHLQSDRWLTLRRDRYGCVSLRVAVRVYWNAASIHNLISSPRLRTITRKTWAKSITMALCFP